MEPPVSARPPLPFRVLVVDDDPLARRPVADTLRGAGYEPVVAVSVAEASRLAEACEPALAILELVLPDGDGLSLLTDLRALWPALPAVIVTGYVEPRSIVEAMRRGAVEYLAKPVDTEILLSTCRAALARRPAPGRASTTPPPLVGESPAVARLRDTVQHLAAGRPAGVLVIGEPGSGRTRLAQALHASSGRGGPCLVFHCEDAWEPLAALLGPAGHAHTGVLAAATGGTVVLRDVERLDQAAQLALLAWAEPAAGQVGRPLLVGIASEPEPRSPLIAWLGRSTLRVPPLRERTTDVAPLARHFLAGTASDREPQAITSAAAARLLDYAWPGNLRELRTVMARAASLAGGGPVDAPHVTAALGGTAGSMPAFNGPRPLREITEAYIDHVLSSVGGNRTRAARVLGVARETLRQHLRQRPPAR